MKRTASTDAWLILLAPDAWQILGPPSDEPPPPAVAFPPDELDQQAAPILAALAAAGWRKSPLVMALSPAMCLAATVDAPAPALLRKRQAMRFHMESWIPWSAEEFVCDYVAHKRAAIMVAVETGVLSGLLRELDAQDARVVAVTPAPLLPLERHLAGGEAPENHALVWRHDDQIELFVISGGQLYLWRRAGGTSSAELIQLCAPVTLEEDPETPWFARGLSPPELDELAERGIDLAPLPEIQWDAALLAAASSIAGGATEPLINLRRDELAGDRPIVAVARQLRRLKLAAAALFLAVCGALWLRGDQFAQQAGELDRRLVEVYEKTFPAEPPPERIVATMKRAQRLLQGTRGPVKELHVGPSSDIILERVLTALPTDLRYRVPEIRIEGGSVYLAGEVRSNADADRIAGALRSGGFEVDSPRTQRLADQGFSVRVAGQFGEATKSEKRK